MSAAGPHRHGHLRPGRAGFGVGWRHGWHGRTRQRPPWWPEGESWPPRPPWRRGHRRARLRVLAVVLAVFVLVGGIGFVAGVLSDPGWRADSDSQRADDERRGPFGLVAVAGMVAVVGSVATALAYRRLGRPVGELLSAADRVASGDYEVAVEPEGPRELRRLTTTFNGMAAQLATTDEQRRRFLADVTHELRTPLAVLQSGIEAQLDGIHPRDDAHLASLLEETRRLGHLVNDLHTLALADAGRLTLHRERCRPATLVEDAVADHATLAANKDVQLRPSVADGLPDVDVDPTRFRQILDNLLSNAIRHTPPAGAVDVDVRVDAGHVRVTVADAGPGFPPERLAWLFDRDGGVRPMDARGSGLGLSIVHDLVVAHGGTIEAQNRPAGGASVSFSVPAAPDGHP